MDYKDLFDPEKFVENKQQFEYINKLLSRLLLREEKTIRLYYGIGYEKHSLRQIGELYNVTNGRILQILKRSERKLRGISLKENVIAECK